MSDYEKLYALVKFIANDYVELSHEKVAWQRDDYIKRCRSLLKEVTVPPDYQGSIRGCTK